jgi:hypothetical protein
MRNVHKIFVGNREYYRQFGTLMSGKKDDIKMNLRRIGVTMWAGLKWLKIWALVSSVFNFTFP